MPTNLQMLLYFAVTKVWIFYSHQTEGEYLVQSKSHMPEAQSFLTWQSLPDKTRNLTSNILNTAEQVNTGQTHFNLIL